VKTYPLEICTLCDIDGGGTTCYYSKGHHPVTDFIAEAMKEHEVIVWPENVRLAFMRWEFAAGPDGPTHCGEEHGEQVRGSFPVTICDRWKDWEE
jgi:hypothetical protein